MVLKAPTLTAPRHSLNAAKNAHSSESSHGHPSNLNIFSPEISERLCQDDIILCVSEAFSPFKDGKVSK